MNQKTNQHPNHIEKWSHLVILAVIIIIWEALNRSGRISNLFFPSPSNILLTLYTLSVSGELAINLLASLERLLVGLFFGCITGLLLGAAMGWSKQLRSIVDPIIAALHPIPKISILPLIMIVFGIGETSKIIVVGISVFFPMLINTMVGVRQINPIYFEVAKNYGASTRKLFTRVIIPASLPMVMSGLRLAVNTALIITIAVELVAAQEGLGAMIWLAWEVLRTEELYASLIVITLLGIVTNASIQLFTRRLIPWSALQEQ